MPQTPGAIGCCQLEGENTPLDRGRAWLPSPLRPQHCLSLLQRSPGSAAGPEPGTGPWGMGRTQHQAGQDVTAPSKRPESPARVTLELAELDQAGIAVLGKGNGEK